MPMNSSGSLRRRAQLGIGLIEVLVAMFVIAIGLLGVAKMQGVAIADSTISSRRAIAAMQAASLASMMHANKGYWAGGGAPAVMTLTGTANDNSALSSQSAVCTTNICTPIQMAAFDLSSWAGQLADLLPTGETATIRCSQVTNVPVTCTIEINWQELSVALNKNASQGGTESAPKYTLYVEP